MDLETEEVNMGEVLTGPYTSSVSPQPTVLEANDEARHQTACEVPQAEVSFMAPQPAYATDAEPLRNLIVNYLPPMMDETQLFQLFAQFGPIESVKIIYDKVTRESRGYGFVKYTFFFSATYAVHWLNGYHIAGKRLKVAFANAEAAYPQNFKLLTLRFKTLLIGSVQACIIVSWN
uniref:Putative RNA-binding protein n=1 Tax=Trypanosoma congolense (strain IL3000) TaxID=1068625 RepID=G0UZ50_TRYCI|nr:putative RNA-binding protein [Trypanosoma congolense IL3000]